MMNKIEVVMNVFKTNDYSIFNNLIGNREVTKIGALKNKADFSKEYPFQAPIIINDDYEVIDGQHRLEICKENNKSVYFIISKDADIETVYEINDYKHEWKIKDFVLSYKQRGNEVYLWVDEFSKSLNLPHSMALIFTTKTGQVYSDKIIRSGELEFNISIARENFKENTEKYKDVKRVLENKINVGKLKKNFFSALIVLFNEEGYNHEHFIKQLEKYYSRINNNEQTKRYYLSVMEDIYNYNSRKRPICLFEE